ncbi:cell envelope integrity protein TolA [Candidatus Sulfurimonas baltica]|uniref:Energy transducer TonB n=1 Tax=Candidatus Sulfurimonas baltica TaxID=2740404 RepID=A0A7S7RMG6_9BACT|nr:TonB family protein [Candidatus Sulfurimonas baltica]QOY51315.1 energy transducer TonB [Candidatus Sulfurimonas baltica]
MINHRRPLIISLIFHSILILTVLFTWRYYSENKKAECETTICVQLSALQAKEITKEPLHVENKKPQTKPKNTTTEDKIPSKKIEIAPVIAPIIEEVVEPKAQDSEKIKEIHKIKEKVIVKEDVIEKKIVIEEKIAVNIADKVSHVEPKKEEVAKEYLKINTKKITQLLQDNLYYPRSARKRNITGEVIIRFTLGVDCEVYDIEIVNSKNNILSRAAVKTIEDLSGKFPKPDKKIILNVPINYNLSE